MIVDVQTHFAPDVWRQPMLEAGMVKLPYPGDPPKVVTTYRGVSVPMVPDFADLDLQAEVNDKAGVTHRMLSMPMIVTLVNEAIGVSTIDVAQQHNDAFAEIRDLYAGTVFPYGTVKPHDGHAAVRETQRCIEELGFTALTIDSSYGTGSRQYDHVVETFPFWEYVNDQRIPVFIHPPFLPYGGEWMDRYKFDETVARPHDTGLNAALMIVSGLFDRFPNLRIILAHMGGSLPMILPRLQFADRLGYDGMLGYQQANLEMTPKDYALKHFWVDTMGFDAPGIRHVIDLFGIDHVLLGTDYGPLPMSPTEHIDIIREDLGLSETDQDKVLGRNAADLLKLANE